MASPFDRAPSRRQSMLNTPNDGDKELAHSLKQLSLSTSPGGNPPRTPSALSPLRPSVNRTSPAPSPRLPSRSPSFARELSRSRSSTPTLQRSSTPTLQRSSTPTLQRKTSTSSLHSVGGSSSRTPSRAPSRRTSMAHASSPVAKSPLRPNPPEYIKPPPTASMIARDYFKTELDVHHSPTSTRATEALVILHDACYGHRFSRPKTSRGALSTIVERPERIKAGVLGVAMAYVRLGERHCDGLYALHPSLDPSSIPTIPFRIYKTDRRLSLTSPAVTNVHGTKWMEELKMMCDVAEAKLATGGKELQRPEMNRGAEGPPAKFHEGDLYLCSESLEAFEGALGAVCEAIDRVFTSGPRRAFVAVRPPGHHCSASYPSGFCWINNVHVGIMHAILNHGLTHAAIIDFDLHHGDGSQAIAWAHNTRGVNTAKNAAAWKKASIGYFSLHDINSYPCEMGDEEKVKNASLCIDNAHGQNIYNVHLESYGSEKEFWELYEAKYSVLLEKTRKYLKTQAARLRSLKLPPKAAIFFSAGFDASEWETKGMQRHNVNVPTEFYARIAQDVVRIAAEEGLGVDGRVISVLEGGYSDRALYSGIFSHLSGLSGDQTPAEPTRGRSSLGYEMGRNIGAVAEGQHTVQDSSPASLHPYNPSWWASSELDELEVAMGNRPPSPKMVRHSTPPTYSTPTQASIGKAVDPARMRRMASGLSNGMPYSRPPTPPPPDVHWTVAAHELSRLLIPSDRQVDSCKPEDLNAEATRARRDRQSILNPDLVPPAPAPAPAPAPVSRPTSRMSLRERKPAKPGMYVDADEDDDKQSKNRRRTVAGSSALSSDKATARGIPSDTNGAAKRPGRRLSAVSSVVSNASEAAQGGHGVPAVRPDTSMSVRPDSAMSVRTQSGTSLTVKKTRVPAAKKEAPKTTRTVKKPTAATKPSPPQQGQPSQPPQQKPSPAAASEDDMDKLTTSMKKVKINLITKTQKEERAKAAQAAQAKAATPPAAEGAKPTFITEVKTPIAPSPMAPPIVTPPQDEAFATPPTQPPASEDPSPPAPPVGRSEVSTPVTEQMSVAVTPDPRQLELPGSSPVTSSAVATPSGSDVFISYQPQGPAPVSMTPQEPLKWLPPNTDTPVRTSPSKPSPAKLSPAKSSPTKKSPVKMMRADLPVFTATSAIPFASQRPNDTPEIKQEPAVKVDPDRPAKSIWEIPETPQKQ